MPPNASPTVTELGLPLGAGYDTSLLNHGRAMGDHLDPTGLFRLGLRFDNPLKPAQHERIFQTPCGPTTPIDQITSSY